MATPQRTTGLTYADLEVMFPEQDMVIRNLIDGELFVTPSPTRGHQRVVIRLIGELFEYEKRHGGEVLTAPLDVYFSDSNVVEPDVLYILPEHLETQEKRYVRPAPDLVVEVSSPATKRIDRGKKRDLYERFGVPEYWFVDLDHDHIEVHRLEGGRYAPAALFGRPDTLSSSQLTGFSIEVDPILGPATD